MRLNSLQLVNFRNYNNLYLEFNKKVNLLLGKNGQGKTNIVESIYMLSFGKSFRTSRDKEIIKFETENLYVGGSFSKEHTDGLIEIAIGKNKKGIKVNKIHIQKIHELLGNLNVVIFSPEDLRLVKEGPKERRSFIDKEISQIMPKYYNYLTNYNKVLFQRNQLLKTNNIDEALLDVYDESLARYGSYLYILRRDFIKKIVLQLYFYIFIIHFILKIRYPENLLIKTINLTAKNTDINIKKAWKTKKTSIFL